MSQLDLPGALEPGRLRAGRVPAVAEDLRDACLGDRVDGGPGGRVLGIPEGRVARFAYADPPYPGKAGYYDERQEVDHLALVAELEAGWPDGWALSTSAAALRDVLALCPAGVRVCVWRRRTRPTRSRQPLSAWEPLLVVQGRELAADRPQGILDVLDYRGRYDAFPGAMVGMKPLYTSPGPDVEGDASRTSTPAGRDASRPPAPATGHGSDDGRRA